MPRAYTWEELAGLTLPRQFARVRGRGSAAVVELLRRVGPIQSQAARAPYLCVAARLPGASYDALTSAYDSLAIVRSTSLRGTVHTSTREQHAPLAGVAGKALAPGLRRLLLLDDDGIAGFRAELERLAGPGWTSHDDLVSGIVEWLRSNGHEASVATLDRPGARYSMRGHPAMLRRPRAGGGWDSQAEVVNGRLAPRSARSRSTRSGRCSISCVRTCRRQARRVGATSPGGVAPGCAGSTPPWLSWVTS